MDPDADSDMRTNPFLAASGLPYQLPPFASIRESDYGPALELGMAAQLAEIAALTGVLEEPSYDNTVLALERSGQVLRRVLRVFHNQAAADTTPGVQAVQAEFGPRLAAHEDAIHLDAALFARVRAVYQDRGLRERGPGRGGKLGESEGAGVHGGEGGRGGDTVAGARLVERYYTDFVRAGALLDAAAQDRLRELNGELARLATEFERNLFEDTRARAVVLESAAELEGLSDDAVSAAASNAAAHGLAGKYLLSLQLPSNQQLLASLARRSVRQRLYEASVGRGSVLNRTLVVRIAQLRAERAALLGYPSHAAYVVADQTAGSVSAVESLLRQLVAPAVANARREAAALRAAFAADGFAAEEFAPWDWQFYAEKVRKAEFDVDASDLRPYFELERVLRDGVFFAARRIYGLRFEERTDLAAYHADARVFEVFEEDGTPLGLFVGDFYARASKRGGAWMNALVPRSGLFDTDPVVVNNLNLAKPAGGEPTLLTFDEVRTLFHEFGHALHGLFTDVYAPRLAEVPTDFVEYPSQVNEMWMIWPEVLGNYAKHYQTGESIPPELVARMQASARFGQGFKTVEYLGAALLDWAWHTIPAGADPGDAPEFEARALADAGIAFPEIPPRYRSTYFAHAFQFGYAAGYYSYIWSEVLDAETVDWFKENGGMLRENGERFRRVLLSRGSSVDPMQAFRELRGREPRIDGLVRRRGLEG
ncbi:MAG TPA: M3 family metallopeptidase [Actinocrinis sp.]|nr:M3 family metallopeptidase [Actinocrinis sp.]